MAMAFTMKRKRRRLNYSSTTTPPNRWADELLLELLDSTLKKLTLNFDNIIRFEAACSSWLMLRSTQWNWRTTNPPMDRDEKGNDYFFSLVENKVYEMD
ncbi:F-box protein SKIP23 [Prunus yedoensis var. nudiflora]|uniref:F-box protein SKIP23 n=1 Tax=Prunus yedoensis var. nudiflora TaxID=2094558 RepID=A0A314XW78_PRUYE|nr:F-box protein SKIP23 [Prunus yedoensis var. nudiflora]